MSSTNSINYVPRFSFVRVSSEDKNNKNDSNSNFNVNLAPSGGNLAQVTKVSLKYVTCPNAFYNVPVGKNILVFVDSGAPLVEKSVIVQEGQYNASQFILALQTGINAQVTSGTVTVTLDPITQKLNFVSPGLPIKFIYATSTMADIVGFGPNDTQSLQSLTMPYPINLSGEPEVYIHSKTLAIGRLNEAQGNFSVMGVIPMNVAFGENAYYTAPDEELDTISYAPYQTARTLEQIDITLRARDGRILNLPNNFYFAMILQVYYK